MAWLIKRGPVSYIRYSHVKRSAKAEDQHTGNFQLAKEKIREFGTAWTRGDSSLSTTTPIADVLTNYVAHTI